MSGEEGGPAKRPCPQCGKPASGNFCQHCGASMGGRFCTQCGAELTAGSRFCNQCGKPVGAPAPAGGASPSGAQAPAAVTQDRTPGAHRQAAAAAIGGSNLPWWIAGAAMFVMILVVGYFTVRKSPPTAQPSGGPTAQADNPAMGASSVDLSKLTPRQAADMLFNRVMTDLSNNDSTDALEFQPMAVSAYERAEPLDLDGLFHMSLLQRLTDPTAALGTAQRILKKDPDHLLGLGAAAEAAAQLGKTALATKYYKHILAVYDKQMASPLPEYGHHKPYVDDLKNEAKTYLVQH